MIKTTMLSKKICLHEIKNTKFKINKISIHFLVPFLPKNASTHTALALMLVKQCHAFPSTLLLGQKLKSLYGAELNSNCVKFGDLHIISFSIAVLENRFSLNNESLLEQAFELLCDVIFNPKTENNQLNQQDIKIEKQNLIELISSSLSDKQQFAQINATKLLFENENCAHPSFGTIEEARQINQTNLTNSYNNILKSSQIHIIASGQTNFERLKIIFSKHIQKLDQNNLVTIENKQFTLSNHQKLKEQNNFDDIMQSKLILGFAPEKKITNDLLPAINIMIAILGATPTSKLFSIVREKLSLCYYCTAKFDIGKKVLWVLSGTEKNNINTAKMSILDQLNKIKKGEFTKKELQESKQWLTDNLRLANDDIGLLENFYLKKILINEKASIDSEIEALNKINSDQIIYVANLFHHSLTYALISKN